MKKAGSTRHAFLAFDGDIINGTGSNDTDESTWYIVLKKGEPSGIPVEVPLNTPFQTPAGVGQFTLETGDQLLKIDFERFCKTTADFSMEQGSIDVGDDCDPGAEIADGITKISGSLAGFFQFDDATGEFIDMTDKIFNIFVPFLEDDGNGNYEFTQATNRRILLGLCLNSDAAVGQIENWFLLPINITSIAASGGNTDGQSLDISWTKGEGAAVKYSVPRAA